MTSAPDNATLPRASDDADRFSVAHDLLAKAADARKKGDTVSANRLLAAAGNIMNEGGPTESSGRSQPNGTQQVADLLRTGWHEVSQIKEATGIDANRIHVIIGRLKVKGGMETQTVKRYRIVDSK